MKATRKQLHERLQAALRFRAGLYLQLSLAWALSPQTNKMFTDLLDALDTEIKTIKAELAAFEEAEQ